MLILSANLEYKKCIYNKCIATTTYIYYIIIYIQQQQQLQENLGKLQTLELKTYHHRNVTIRYIHRPPTFAQCSKIREEIVQFQKFHLLKVFSSNNTGWQHQCGSEPGLAFEFLSNSIPNCLVIIE